MPNTTSIRIYKNLWHALLHRPTDLHFIHRTKELWMFDVKRKKWSK